MELSAQLRVLGLGEDASAAYQELLRSGPATATQLSEARRHPEPAIRRALDQLVEVGLAATTGSNGTRYVPVSPQTGLEVLSLRRASELQQARVAALNAYEVFRRTVYAQSTDDLVEVVTGPAIVDRIQQVEAGVQREIRRLDSPPYYLGPAANPNELEHLSRGVGYRVVYAQASLEVPDYLSENILPSVQAGEQARVLPAVPVKLTLVDQSLALVSLTIEEAEVNRSLLIVRPCSLFSALAGLFEYAWRAALPLHPEPSSAPRAVTPLERRLLALLAAGAGDDTIARTLGVSRRTFFRYLEKLMARAGATTRFQLALHASRQGWL
ncbi:MAG: helix-turn-helix domain-containing protein [Micromonosporaceae bacterium]